MRRLAFAAVCGTLVLAACSDQPTAPTGPSVTPPEQHLGCRAAVLFPLKEVSKQILDYPTSQVFATKRLKLIALAKAAGVALLWDTCRRIPAQKFAVEFVNWIDQNASGASPTKTITLKITILNGVGVPVEQPAEGDPTDFAVIWYDPASTTNTVAATASGRAGIWLRAGSSGLPAFNEPSVITIRRKGDHEDFDAFFDAAHQPGPVWDYNVTNSSTTNTDASHEVANFGSVIIAFCYLPGGDYSGERMFHITVEGNLEEVASADIPPELLALLVACNEEGGLTFRSHGSGLSGFAHATWSAAGHYLGRFARLLFLPTPLRAAEGGAAVVGKGPTGGTPVGLSPFTIVLEGCLYGGYCGYGGGID
jgi:hypothetical protein